MTLEAVEDLMKLEDSMSIVMLFIGHSKDFDVWMRFMLRRWTLIKVVRRGQCTLASGEPFGAGLFVGNLALSAI